MSDDDTRPIPPAEQAPAEQTPDEQTPDEQSPDETGAPQAEPPTVEMPAPVPGPALAGAAAGGHIRVVAAEPTPAAPRPELRVGTVVWGLVVAAIGIGLMSLAWGAHLDGQLALIVLLGAAGVALLVGSLVGLRRSRSQEEGRG